MKWATEVQHPSGVLASIRLSGETENSARQVFLSKHPSLVILSMVELPETPPPQKLRLYSSKQRRAGYKVRIRQLRSTLQAISEDEYTLLTDGERVQIHRLVNKINHLLGQWHAKTLELKHEGLL